MGKCSICNNKVGFIKYETVDESIVCKNCYKEVALKDEEFLEHKRIRELEYEEIMEIVGRDKIYLDNYNNYYKKKIQYRIGSMILSMLLLILMFGIAPMWNEKPLELSLYVLGIILIIISIEIIIILSYYKKLLKDKNV